MKISKSYFIPLILGIILISVVTFWVYHEMVLFGYRTMRIIKQEGQITTKAIKGIIQSQMVAGKISKGRLEFILSNIVDQTILKYVCIKKDNKIIFESKNNSYKSIIFKNDKSYRDDIFFFKNTMKMEIPPPPFIKNRLYPFMRGKKRIAEEKLIAFLKTKEEFKKHPEDFIDFNNSIQTVIVGLDVSIFKKQMDTEFHKTIIFYILSCVAIIVLALSWIYMLKNSKLKIKYTEIKTKTAKLEELSLAATGLAHEVKNPLGIIRGLTQEIAKNPTNSKLVTEIAEKIIDEADITTERLSDFMNYAKHKKPKVNKVEVKTYFNEIIDMLHYELNEKGLKFNARIENLKIIADREFLDQIIINIVMNSINACDSGNSIKIKVELYKNNNCSIEISDDGPGIKEDLMANIFKPYVSGSPNGHGIGLAIVKKLADELDWEIDMISQVGEGTKTIISNIKIMM